DRPREADVVGGVGSDRLRRTVPARGWRCEAGGLRTVRGRADAVRLRRLAGAVDRTRTARLPDLDADPPNSRPGLDPGDRISRRGDGHPGASAGCLVPLSGSARGDVVAWVVSAGASTAGPAPVPSLMRRHRTAP